MLYLIDLFCGAGGFSQGATQAGATVVLGIDCWGKALDIHTENHPSAKHINMKLGPDVDHSSLANIITSSIPTIFDGSCDKLHIHASPPCQQLSTVNGARDESAGLAMTLWALKFLDDYFKTHLQNSSELKIYHYSWTIEQVHNRTLVDILSQRGIANRTFNMIDFGVCQTRKRLVVSSTVLNITQSPRQTMRQVLDTVPELRLPKSCVRIAGAGDWRTTDRFSRKTHTKCCETEAFPTIIRNGHYMLDTEYKTIGLLLSNQSAAIQTFPLHYFDTAIKNYTQRVCNQLIANSVPPAFAERIVRFIN